MLGDCDMTLPLLCCARAHTLEFRPFGPAQAMRDPAGSVVAIPRLHPDCHCYIRPENK